LLRGKQKKKGRQQKPATVPGKSKIEGRELAAAFADHSLRAPLGPISQDVFERADDRSGWFVAVFS
jgi:hypothetical protein